MEKKKTMGHLTALFTVLIWGTTFISTKVLLDDFQPVEILFFRFVMGYMALFAAAPRWLKGPDWKQEVCSRLPVCAGSVCITCWKT